MVAILAVLVLSVTASLPLGSASLYPVLPVATYGRFLSNLSAPTLSPGSSGTVAGVVGNPLTSGIDAVQLTLALYAFNAFDGNATGPIPSAASAVLVSSGSSAPQETIDLGSLTSGQAVGFSVGVSTGPSAPEGLYAIRCALAFTQNGTAYRLQSRGFFSLADWENATAYGGNATTLNVSRLGVSGVVPETALLVRAEPATLVLPVVLGVAILLAGVGGYLAWRRGPGSRSGAERAGDPHNAPSAFGKRRRSDGD